MPKIRHDLLIKLGQIMRSVKPKNLNMDYIAREPECGSVGCALGYAAMNKTFQKEGLSLVWVKNNLYNSKDVGLKYKSTKYVPGDFDLVGAKVFGITPDEAYELFKPSHGESDKPSDKEVFLERFRTFMKRKNLHM